MKSPRTVIGAVAQAISLVALVSLLLTCAVSVIASGWLFQRMHGEAWIMGLLWANGAILLAMGLVKAAAGRRAKVPPDRSGSRRLAGPGATFRPR